MANRRVSVLAKHLTSGEVKVYELSEEHAPLFAFFDTLEDTTGLTDLSRDLPGPLDDPRIRAVPTRREQNVCASNHCELIRYLLVVDSLSS